MFQNIVEEVQEKEERASLKIKENFKSIFKYQNIIIYILTFFFGYYKFKRRFFTFWNSNVGCYFK